MRGAAGDRFYVALVVMVALIFLLSGTVRVTNGSLQATAWFGAVTEPVDAVVSKAVGAAATSVGFIAQMWGAESKVRTLQHQNELLRLQLYTAQDKAFQVPELQKLFKLDSSPQLRGKVLAADIIGRAPATWFDTVVIDRGTKMDVHVNDPVLAPAGLAGRVIAATYFTSTVLLLPDPQSSIGAMDARSRDVGVITGEGTPTKLTLEFFSGSARVHTGDDVMTSGLTGLAPKGLLIGQVASVRLEDDGLVKVASVTPFVDFNALEYVLVMVHR